LASYVRQKIREGGLVGIDSLYDGKDVWNKYETRRY